MHPGKTFKTKSKSFKPNKDLKRNDSDKNSDGESYKIQKLSQSKKAPKSKNNTNEEEQKKASEKMSDKKADKGK